MTQRDEDPLAPETVNREQEDEGQALDAADMAANGETLPIEESEKGGADDPGELIPQDTPDLIDRMEQMVSSGRIDNGAFAGEPVHDDEESSLGDEDEIEDDEDDEIDEDDAVIDTDVISLEELEDEEDTETGDEEDDEEAEPAALDELLDKDLAVFGEDEDEDEENY